MDGAIPFAYYRTLRNEENNINVIIDYNCTLALLLVERRTLFLYSARRFIRMLDRGDKGCSFESSILRGDAIGSDSFWGDGILDDVLFVVGDIAGITGNGRCSDRNLRIRFLARIAIDDVDADEFTVSLVTCDALSSWKAKSAL
jgi:hypothetical protein